MKLTKRTLVILISILVILATLLIRYILSNGGVPLHKQITYKVPLNHKPLLIGETDGSEETGSLEEPTECFGTFSSCDTTSSGPLNDIADIKTEDLGPVPPRFICEIPPSSWMGYTIQAGDTLSQLALDAGISVPQLQRANCLADSMIVAGNLLYIPNIPPSPTAIIAPNLVSIEATSTPGAVAMVVETPVVTSAPPLSPVGAIIEPESSSAIATIVKWLLSVIVLVLVGGVAWWLLNSRNKTQPPTA